MSDSSSGFARPATCDSTPGSTRIVGLGASAGGLLGLEQFFAHLPADTGLAYIVVQHLDPNRKALLVELLQRACAIPVVEATELARVHADTVYVIPPNRELTVVDGALRLTTPMLPRGLRLPIDLLFSSLAKEQGDRAIGIVLSGMGADGTLGLQAIKSQGGLTLVQSPESAQFDSMPRNAITSGCADIVALPADMPYRIHLVTVSGATLPLPANDEEPNPEDLLSAILEQLRKRSRHDLSQYKPSTLRRRVERRMAVHGLRSMAAYASSVRQNPQELDLLFKEMLIGVTSFFRDPPAWAELKDEVLTSLLERTKPGGRLRAWVAGCSTGEEAYSLAMMFREAADAMPESLHETSACSLQIFATDLSADAIAVARKGRYSSKIAADVAPDRLARFFHRQGEEFVVDKSIREMVLFAQHDVILDPPFTRLDLLSCRNLLIYFDARLQRRLLPLFSYSLRPGGALLLGGSESIGASHAQFAPVSPKSRLFWRTGNPVVAGTVEFPTHRLKKPNSSNPEESTMPEAAAHFINVQPLVEQTLLQDFSPPAVLVNEKGDILYISGSIGKYIEPASGKANWNIHVMARPAIRAQVVAGLRQVLQDDVPVQLHGLRLDDEASRSLEVTVMPLKDAKSRMATVLLVFRDVVLAHGAKTRRKRAADVGEPATAEELLRWKEEAQSLRQEMMASAEELQAANEELQSTNEELQSANEELTTSKEEAQSMNEELQTLNSELQSKLDDLALAQSDMQNLLNSTEIATLFLDSSLNVRRYTDQVTRIIHLRESDIGRPLTDLASTLIYPNLVADARETLRTLNFIEKEIVTTDEHWYLVRIKPYRTLADVIQGVVITLIDITAAKVLESQLRNS